MNLKERLGIYNFIIISCVMEEIDIDNNVKHFSLFVSSRILDREKEAIWLAEEWKFEDAIKIYTSLIDIAEYQDDLYTNRWIDLYRNWENKRAIQDLEKALYLNPENDLAKEVLADVIEEEKINDLNDNYLTFTEIIERWTDEEEIQKWIDEWKLKGILYEWEIFYLREDIANCM